MNAPQLIDTSTASEKKILGKSTLWGNSNFVTKDRPPVKIRSFLFGTHLDQKPILDWTLANFKKAEDGLAPENAERAMRLVRIMKELEIEELLAPFPVEFNGRICQQSELTITIELPEGFRLLRGANADGAFIKKGQAMAWSVGGCAIGVFVHQGKVIATHLGRDCLFDRQRIETGKASRKHESGVEAALVALGAQHNPSETYAEILFPISASAYQFDLDDPMYATFNQKMRRYIASKWGESCVRVIDRTIQFDIAKLAIAQCMKFGLSRKQVVTNLPIDATMFTFHTRHEDPDFRDKRNLAIVYRP